jgi:hypothetical protein
MTDDRGFVYTGIALLLAIPAVVLVASLANMMEIGGTTTALVVRTDSVYYPCEDIKGSFEFSVENYASVYGAQQWSLVEDRLQNRWLPTVINYFSDAGINIEISSINVSFDSSTNSVKVWSEDQDKGINITITDEKGATKCEATSGPLTINVGLDEEGPIFIITSPGNRTICNTPPFNVSLTYSSSETAFDVKYSLNGSTNVTVTANTNITVNNYGQYTLTLFGVDAFNNSGWTTTGFYVKNWSYVTNATNNSGTVTGISPAQDPSDGNASTNITEITDAGVLHYPPPDGGPGNFTDSAAGWSNTSKGDLVNIHQNSGALDDTIYSEAKGAGQEGNGSWTSSFTYNFNGSTNANLSFDYKVDKFSNEGSNNWFNVTLYPQSPAVQIGCGPGGVTGTGSSIKFNLASTTGWTSIVCQIPADRFDYAGAYSLVIYLELSTGGNGWVKVHFDNVKLDVATPSGYQYDVETVTDDSADPVHWQDHELQVRYRMPDPDGEDTNIRIWDGNASGWVNIPTATPLANTTAFTTFSYNMTYYEWNNGYVRVRYNDDDPTDVNPSKFQIDYQKVC